MTIAVRALSALVAVCAAGVVPARAQPSPDVRTTVRAAFARLPLSFEENRGQAPAGVRFFARGPGYTLFLKDAGAELVLPRAGGEPVIVRVAFAGAQAGRVAGVNRLAGTASYFTDSDPSTWLAGVATFGMVRYEGIYPGIDLMLYGNPQHLEYDFVVAPGADPAAIALAFDGGDDLRIGEDGALVVATGAFDLRFSAPVVYQDHGSARRTIEGRYVLKTPRSVGFELGAYDPALPVVIDPVLVYSTYLPGLNFDAVTDVAVDAGGHAYVTGVTSPPFSTCSLAPPAVGGNADVFVTKLNPAGTAVIYSACLGGHALDVASAIAVDAQGHAYVTGHTQSANFPTVSPLQPTLGGPGQASFIAKLNPAGSALLFSTYFGGIGVSRTTAIAVDAAANVYLAGVGDPPSMNSIYDTGSSFLAKVASSGSVMLYATKLGGTGFHQAHALAVDPSRNVYVAGSTSTSNVPTHNALQPARAGGLDGFITKIASSVEALPLLEDAFESENGGLTAIDYTAFARWTVASGTADLIALDSPEFVPGSGSYVRLGGAGAAASVLESRQTFRLSPEESIFPAANKAVYRLEFGLRSGPAGPLGTGPTVIVRVGSAFVETFTIRDNAPAAAIVREFPVTSQTDARVTFELAGGDAPALIDDVALSRLKESPSVTYATYFGGTLNDEIFGITTDPGGFAYIAGSTVSADFPISLARQPVFAGGASDAFVAKLDPSGGVLEYSSFVGGIDEDVATAIARDPDGNVYLAGFTSSADFPTENALQGQLAGARNAFAAKLTPAFALTYSTYLGGTNVDAANALAVDALGNAYVAGQANSEDFPTHNALFAEPLGGAEGFVVKILDAPDIRLIGLTQSVGGNTGTVTLNILGINFPQGPVAVKLVANGRQDIEAASAAVISATHLRVTFDLQGTAPGARDVVVTFADGTVKTLAGAFTIQPGGRADIWVDIVGRSRVRAGVGTKYYVVVGNSGNVDGGGVPVTIRGLPADGEVRLDFEIADPSNGAHPVLGDVPDVIDTPNGRVLPLFLPLVPAGATLTFPLTIEAGSSPFTMTAGAGTPYIRQHGPDPAVIARANACFEDAVGLLGDVVGLVPGAECVTAVGTVVIDEVLASHGRALNASLGVEPQPEPLVDKVLDGVLSVGASCLSSAVPLLRLLDAGLIVLDAFDTFASCGPFSDPDGAALAVTVVAAIDPNEKTGADGVGAERYVSGLEPMRYAVYFENLATATAPAADIVVEDQLDTTALDVDTLRFGPVSFGDITVTPAPGASSIDTEVDLRPDRNLLVRVTTDVNRESGVVRWRLTAIDPATGQPTEDPSLGVLPPNVNPPEGDGSVFFTVAPKAETTHDTEVRNRASIVFDANAPLDTPDWVNRLDLARPSSSVTPLDLLQCSLSIPVQWSGDDSGSGVLDYTVFVSDNGGPFEEWLSRTTDTSGTFPVVSGHTYAFYSVARDRTGNVEEPPSEPDAIVSVADAIPPVLTCPSSVSVPATSPLGAEVAFTVAAVDACGAATVACSPAAGSLFPIRSTTVACSAADGAGNTATCEFPVQVQGAAEQLNRLLTLVRAAGIHAGIENSLAAKLQTTQARLGTSAACNALAAFESEVAAQLGRKVPAPLGAELLQAAARIRSVMACE